MTCNVAYNVAGGGCCGVWGGGGAGGGGGGGGGFGAAAAVAADVVVVVVGRGGGGSGGGPVIPPVNWKGVVLPRQRSSRTMKTLPRCNGFYSVSSVVERSLYLRDFFYYFDLCLRDFLNEFFKYF